MNDFIKDSLNKAGQFYSLAVDFAKNGDSDAASSHCKWAKEQIDLAEMKTEEEILTAFLKKK